MSWGFFRHRLEELGCRFLAWTIPKLSRKSCVSLARAVGALAYCLERRGRRVALANLECAFGDRFSEKQRRVIARASYQNFARTMLDLFWAPVLTADNVDDYIPFEGIEMLKERHARNPGGSICLCPHFGNWEWSSLAAGFHGFHATIVTETFRNPRLAPVFNELRQSSGQRIIPQENSLLRFFKTVKRGGAVAMLPDLTLPPTQAATVIEAFGLKMCVSRVHALLIKRAGALAFPVQSDPRPDGRCLVRIHPPLQFAPDATTQQITQECWDAIEPWIRARPECWLWPYKFFRYKPGKADRAYPFYANESAKFEKLLAQQEARE